MGGIEREDWDRFTREMSEFQGRTDANLENIKAHIGAVSGKADAIRGELQAHANSDQAHGLGGERRATSGVVAWGGLLLGGLSFIYSAIKDALGAKP